MPDKKHLISTTIMEDGTIVERYRVPNGRYRVPPGGGVAIQLYEDDTLDINIGDEHYVDPRMSWILADMREFVPELKEKVLPPLVSSKY